MEPPLCFILMPFGRKPDPAANRTIDFDDVFERAIRKGIEAAGMSPLRGDLEARGGLIHKQFFERLILCDFAVADLTTNNANVYYEFGARHAIRPRTTVAITAHPERMPFDVAPLRAIPYALDSEGRLDESQLPRFIEALTTTLKAAHERERRYRHDRRHESDSPLFDLINGFTPPEIEHLRADLFPDRIRSEQEISARIADVRAGVDFKSKESVAAAVASLDGIREELGAIEEAEATPVLELLLAYRAVSAWDRIVAVYDAMPELLKRQALPREQLGMALNRLTEKTGSPTYAERALTVLEKLEEERGANPETSSLIGRVHKARWKAARDSGDLLAAGHLRKAIAAYRRGFEANWCDFYPGVNLATLLFIKGDADAKAELAKVLPVVRYSAEHIRIDDYWKHATLLEIAVLAGNAEAAEEHLSDAVTRIKEGFQPTTTADNLDMILSATAEQDALQFVAQIVQTLRARSMSA
ncbi:TRAFs-binding domain-containing protein [Acuticoccus sp. I52.16.1]|uniref:TRAFs-binding domain-containing protein n=1 Tax=Acuticoccus sp. I52.16.1 TaxID=2928472 RepID=UPI001FD46A0E|nr:TRAFs-binding domain-containing protein [Acuticoccus sp. I52.16.1]UOM36708.1 DUF4071 domain-containing protein [Acuticoccus sp. I52.16.1]